MKVSLEISDFLPDCEKCHGLCCVALAFDWPDYAKPAGEPCKNLDDNYRCRKWSVLEDEGYTECRSFDCFGAGQAVTQLFKDQSLPGWRDGAESEHSEMSVFQRVYSEMFASFKNKKPPMKNDPAS